MVKTVSRHWCELCGAEHKTVEMAARCEDQGVPVPQLVTGDYVALASDVHGWWGEDASWALTMPKIEGERHGPASERSGEWRLPSPDDARASSLRAEGLGNWWLPLYRVVHVGMRSNEELCRKSGVTGLGVHDVSYVLWNPRHANRRSGEALVEKYDRMATLSRAEAVPVLSEAEAARFDELVAKLAATGRRAVKSRLSVVEEAGR